MKKVENSQTSQTQVLNIPIVMSRFDIERKDLYEYNKPKERTRKRLTEIAECGMEEIGIASFGYKGVMSGLYLVISCIIFVLPIKKIKL